MLVTVAIPCYNSSQTLEFVVSDIKKQFEDKPDFDYQIVLVNDNSKDNTFEVIENLCKKDRKITGVDLSKNYGQVSAQMAAMHFVNGDVAVFMDDDGQHPADEMFKLIEAIQQGNDLVYACFPNKKHSFFKRITSKLNSKLLEWTNRKPRGIKLSSYFALSSVSINALKKYRSPYPSIGGYLLQITRRVVNVEVTHKERIAGNSNYTLKKMITLWMQGFTNFSIAPLRLASFMGVFSAFVGILIGVALVIQKLCNPNMAVGYTSIMATVLFVGGLLMLMIGILGEYIGRMYILLSNMPQFNIRETLNADNSVNESKEDDYEQ